MTSKQSYTRIKYRLEHTKLILLTVILSLIPLVLTSCATLQKKSTPCPQATPVAVIKVS